LHGIDLSPEDLDVAKRLAPEANIECVNALEYLPRHAGTFDVIVLKAVLEHMPKPDVLPLLNAIERALRPGGTVIVDVPNMDWLFAGHERYMDFTHETGFTRESLRQTMSAMFPSLDIFPAETSFMRGRPAIKRRIARAVLGTLLLWADPEGAQNPIWARSLIAVGRK
jgi:SAM-dependent methyltransferase